MAAKARVDFPDPAAPMMPQALPACTENDASFKVAICPPGGTIVAFCMVSCAAGRGKAKGLWRAGIWLSWPRKRAQPRSARWGTIQEPIRTSRGLRSRPKRMDVAIMPPALNCSCRTSQAPSPSMADCMAMRRVLIMVVNNPAISLARSCAT